MQRKWRGLSGETLKSWKVGRLKGFGGKSRRRGQVWREQEGLEKNGGLKPLRYEG
jgi:hypothetical protein